MAFCLLSVIRTQCTYSVDQSGLSLTQPALLTGSGQILRHQYGISVAESQTFLREKSPKSDVKRMFSQAKDTAFDGEITLIRAIYYFVATRNVCPFSSITVKSFTAIRFIPQICPSV